MRILSYLAIMFFLGFASWGVGGCGGGSESSISDPEVASPSESDDTVEEEDDFVPSNYNGTYITNDGLNTCEDIIIFRDEIEISNVSNAGFTWTDEDGEFHARFLTIQDNGQIGYTVDFVSISCAAEFSTSEDGLVDFLRTICLTDNGGCEVLYGKRSN